MSSTRTQHLQQEHDLNGLSLSEEGGGQENRWNCIGRNAVRFVGGNSRCTMRKKLRKDGGNWKGSSSNYMVTIQDEVLLLLFNTSFIKSGREVVVTDL